MDESTAETRERSTIPMDQNVPRAITHGVRLRGVNVLTVFEDGDADLDDHFLATIPHNPTGSWVQSPSP